MTVRTRSQLKADADSSLPDNVVSLIAPEHVRGRIKDLADSALFAEDIGSGAGQVAAGNHVHDIADITGLSEALGNKADKTELFSGSYMDLTDKPSLFSGDYGDLSNKPTLGTAAAADTGDFAAAIHTHTAAQISDASADGRSLITAANYAAMRTAMGVATAAQGALADTALQPGDAASASDIRSMSGGGHVTGAGLAGAIAPITPSGGSNWTPDWSAFAVADWNVTANRTLSNPTNVIPGTTRYVFIRGSSGTPRTITFGSNFKGDLPTLDDVSNTKWYLLSMVAYSATHIVVAAVEASP